MNRPVYKAIASRLQAIINCKESGNREWELRHAEVIERIVRNQLPSGSGFDSATRLSDKSTPNKLIFNTSFHHMNSETGSYDGWTNHVVTITPSLVCDFETSVSGSDRNGIKDYIAETFSAALSQPEKDDSYNVTSITDNVTGVVTAAIG